MALGNAPEEALKRARGRKALVSLPKPDALVSSAAGPGGPEILPC